MPSLLTAVLAGLGGMLGWGIADLFAKRTIDDVGDIVSLVLAHIFGTAFVILIALYAVLGQHRTLLVPRDPVTWAYLFLFGTLQGVVYLLVYRGFGKGQVAVLNPVFSSYSGLTALLSVVFFGETLTKNIALAMAIILLGIMLMNVDIAALRNRRLGLFQFSKVPGFLEILAAAILAAFWTLGWDQFVSGEDWLFYALYMYVFMTAALLAYAWLKGVRLVVPNRSAWTFLALIGVFETSAYVAVSWGYGDASLTSVVAVLSGAFSLPTIIGARLWLQERTSQLQLIGSLTIVLGVVLVSIL